MTAAELWPTVMVAAVLVGLVILAAIRAWRAVRSKEAGRRD